MINEHKNLDKLLITIVAICGSLILFIPVQKLLIALLCAMILLYLLVNPRISYYLVVFTIPIPERIRILPISFSANDICILICIMAILLNIFFKNPRISLKTSIDKWNIVLLVLYTYAGLTSLSPVGFLTTFKFIEAILMFYITVYLIRTKQISPINILKVFLFTGLFQGVLGILQSLTGQFGAYRYIPRGYLGYLGIGSTMVWQACGTIGGTGGLSEFIVDILLIMLPFHKFISAHKRKIIFTIFLLTVYMGYEKLPVLNLLVASLIYYNLTAKNKSDAIFKTVSIIGITGIIILALSSTAFMHTVTESIIGRQDIWSYPLYALSNNVKYLFFGSGLNSYWQLIDPLLPTNIVSKEHLYMLAHNNYLLTIQEMGIIGLFIVYGFYISLGKKFLNLFKKTEGFYKWINLSVFLVIITIFTSDIAGQFYYATYMKVMLFILFGLVLAKENVFKKLKESYF